MTAHAAISSVVPMSERGSFAPASEHPVVVGRRLGDHLQDVPVLDDLPVRVEPEDVDARVVVGAWPGLMAVQDDVVAFREGPDEVDVLAGYSSAMRSKYWMNASLPSATCGLCCRYSSPA